MIFIKSSFSFSFEEFLYLGLSGIIGLALGDLFLFESFLLLGPQLTMLIFTSSPLITLLLSFLFLNEKIGLISFIGIILVIGGISLAILSKKIERKVILKGVFFAVLGAFMQAAGFVLAKKGFFYGIDTLLASFLRILCAFFFTIILLPIFKLKNSQKIQNKKNSGYIFLFMGSIIGPYLGVWFSQIAIKYANTGIAATLLTLSPIFLIPLDAIFEKEKIGFVRIIGTLITIFGIYIILNV